MSLSEQREIVVALQDPKRYPHAAKFVMLHETHISWVLLAGRYAYKIKKAVHPDFLDFTTIEARHFYCSEEIRLNRRLAPMLYLDVVPIGGKPQDPVIGSIPAIEYAVRMKRFGAKNRLDLLTGLGKILPGHVDALAVKIARFHDNLPPASVDSGFGCGILDAVRVTFHALRTHYREDVSDLQISLENEYASCGKAFEERLKNGFIRECHGDLHLGNIVLIGSDPIPFDCMEFDPKLRWIDVMNEIAFPVMDLLYHERPDLASRLLNAYLEHTGDYMGLRVFRFYLSWRAIIRAMVEAIRAFQSGSDAASCRKQLLLASRALSPATPFLLITYGLPGSGKTTFSQYALERLHAIRIRSDVERKRLVHLAPLASSHSGIHSGIYSSEASRAVYSRLLGLARGLLAAGFPVIVDAAFLAREERDRFRNLAANMAVPFAIASLNADYPTLRDRILQRSKQADDASEAGLAVLDAAKSSIVPLFPEESCLSTLFYDKTDSNEWKRLVDLLSMKPEMRRNVHDLESGYAL